MSPAHLLTGHLDAVARWHDAERDFLQHLASHGQSPDALYIGCSDSRVVPELLTASAPGRLFVVRNIANLVPPLEHADASVGAAIEYAIGMLRVPHLIVCGHDGCGGVKAVLDGTDLTEQPSLQEWLKPIEPAVLQAGTEGSKEQRLRRAVEANVLAQLRHLLTFPSVRRALEDGKLQLHGWVYDIHALALRVYDPEIDGFAPLQRLLADGQIPA